MTEAASQIVESILNPPATPVAEASPGKTEAPPGSNAGSAEGKPGAPVTDKVSGKLTVLAQRERQALELEKRIKAKETELSTREAKLKEFEDLKATNPLKALELLGLSYQELSQIALSDGMVPPDVKVSKIEERLDEFEKRQLTEREAQAEAERQRLQRQEQQAIQTFQAEIKKFIGENADKYQLIRFHDADDLVFQVVDEHYNRTLQAKIKAAEASGQDTSQLVGDILTIEAAADKVEAHYEKKYEEAPDKIRSRFLPQNLKIGDKQIKLPPGIGGGNASANPQKPPRTLTNNQTVSPAKPSPRPSEEERIARIIAEFKARR